MNKAKIMNLMLVLTVSAMATAVHAQGNIKISDLPKPQIESSATTTPSATTQQPATLEMIALYKTHNLTPEAALVVAKAAMKNCRDSGYQVSVAVVDRGGVLQVLLRDRLAGIKTPEIAILKAKTALSFKSSTALLASAVQENKSLEPVTDVPGVLFLGGGITITAAGTIIGGIGVSGAPDAKFDERCAIIGLKPIAGMLEFAE